MVEHNEHLSEGNEECHESVIKKLGKNRSRKEIILNVLELICGKQEKYGIMSKQFKS